jgi:hypothetical protein
MAVETLEHERGKLSCVQLRIAPLRMDEWRYDSTHYSTRHYDEIMVSFVARRKSPGYPLNIQLDTCIPGLVRVQ